MKTGSFRRNQPGDVLFALYGATIGKVTILAEPAVTNQAVCGCTPFEGVSNRYLFYYLVSQRAAFHEASEGGAQPNLSKVKIVAFPFHFPSLAEQKRIVGKLDELMALCDRLEAQQQERDTRHTALARASLSRFAKAPTPANLNFLFHSSFDIHPSHLRKSILTLAIQGKLVPHDPNEEPATELLTRLAPAWTKGAAKDKEPHAAPLKPPVTWRWAELRDLVESMANGIYRSARFFSETGTACVRMFNIQDGRLDLATVKRLDLTPAEVEQYRLREGDLLDNRVNSRELVGKCALVPKSDEPLVFEAMNIRVRLTERQHLPRYVNLVLRTERIREFLQASSKQAIGQASINQPQVARLLIPLPRVAEQRRIVAKVDQLMAAVDHLETQLTASRANAEKLMETLVAKLTAKLKRPER